MRSSELAGADAGQDPVRVDAQRLGKRTSGVAFVILAQAEPLRFQLHGGRRPREPSGQRLDRRVVDVGFQVGLVLRGPGPVLPRRARPEAGSSQGHAKQYPRSLTLGASVSVGRFGQLPKRVILAPDWLFLVHIH